MPILKSRKWFASVLLLLVFTLMRLPIAQAAAPDLAQRIIASGMKYIGVPYQYGANPNQTSTFDCSSFTLRAFKENGITLPRTSEEQYQLGTPVSLVQAQPGDLVFFHDSSNASTVDHVGFYMGGGKMINATVSKGVEVVSLETAYWQDRYLGARHVLPARYTVQNGDALWKISGKTGVPINKIVAWNRLNTDALYPGQVLFVANPDLTMTTDLPQRKLYAVKAGDLLWKISLNTGVSIADLINWNHIQNDMIYPGQLLYLDPPARSYTVKAGDTLWMLSQTYGVTIADIKQYNHLNSDYLNVNQTLLIPYA